MMKLNISGTEYALVLKDNVVASANHCFGVQDPGLCELQISKDDMHEQRQARTIMHEAIHAILFEAGHPQHEENQVIALGNGIVSLLRSNPHVLPVLLGEQTLAEAIAEEKGND